MPNAIITVIYQNGPERRLDLEVPLTISIRQCVDMLCTANWLPAEGKYRYETSISGEEWDAANGDDILSDVICGDGSLLRIRLG